MKKIIILIALFIQLINGNDPSTERGLNWYESLPAVAMDYKIHVDAGKSTYKS
jgi:hypothetical protein